MATEPKPLMRSGVQMTLIQPAGTGDRRDAERLIAAYHASEGLTPNLQRISWAISEILNRRVPGVLLVARDEKEVVGVALAVYSPSAELGQVLVVNDFYVEPQARRKGIGRALAHGLLVEARNSQADRIDLEILPTNKLAVMFWRSLGFETRGRIVYSQDLETTNGK